MPYKDNSSDWLFFADSDIKTAEAVLEDGLYHMVCFHSHQAIEKSLKALMRRHDLTIPRTHSLMKLANDLRRKDLLPPNLDEEDLIFVDQFYSPTRYPDTLPAALPQGLPDKPDAERSLQIARGIFSSIQSGH